MSLGARIQCRSFGKTTVFSKSHVRVQVALERLELRDIRRCRRRALNV